MDHAEFFDAFSDPSPGEAALNYRALAPELGGLSEELLPYETSAPRRPASPLQQGARAHWPAFHAEEAGSKLLRHALRAEAGVLVYTCGCSFELGLLQSPDGRLRREVLAIFGSLREDTLVEVMLRYLTRRPRQVLVANSLKVLQSWRSNSYDGFAVVQDRQWTDVRKSDRSGKERNTDRPHLNCTYKRLEAYRSALPGARRLLIGITSDSAAYAEELMRAFSPLGEVRRNRLFSDNTFSYGETDTPLVARQFLVDWYILREAPFVVCTGSTYCLSARASKGFGNDGTFPFASDRRTYRQGGTFCYGGQAEEDDRFTTDTLSHPRDGRVFW
mmetsp:Transcript_73791/g.227897  ORF Transcript_73791/g.227897 Transcript_73791/m.227897 type:complete len:331 (+) Transcript_73791:173-1165(+)